jgi:hypothetical protein
MWTRTVPWRPVRNLLAGRAALIAENFALRQQLAVLQRSVPRPKLRRRDRIFWVWLSRLWTGWRNALIVVQPDTVVRWHRQGFRLYWRWKGRRRGEGRPAVPREVRDLVRRMALANPLWGAPRIHGELSKLGIEISQAASPSTCRNAGSHPHLPGGPSLRTTSSRSSPSTSSSCRPPPSASSSSSSSWLTIAGASFTST